MPASIVLDTTAFSGLIYARRAIVDRYRVEIRSQTRFLLCPVVWYETRHGLLRIAAKRKLVRLNQIERFFVWDEFDRADWSLAADMWATLTARGRQLGDADLLIAVFAARRNARLVTSNLRHFEVFVDHLSLSIEDWPAG